jgi:hypothetical protein
MFLVYATSRPIRTEETPQLVAVTIRSRSPGWGLIRYQDVVSPGAYEEKTRARLGALEVRRARGLIRQMEGGSDTYVPSEANTVLLAEALRVPAGFLLEERERLFEGWYRPDVVG